MDLGSIVHPFMWSDRRFGPHIIVEMLDRFQCNSNWRSYFQEILVLNLVLMEVQEKGKGKRYIKKKTFPRVH